MNIYHWIVGRFSMRRRSLAIYKRGMARAKKHDHQAAIDDYTMAIGMPQVPADVKAMALFNRAIVYAAADNVSKAAEDLQEVLGMPEAPTHVKTEATRKLARMQQRSDRQESRTIRHD